MRVPAHRRSSASAHQASPCVPPVRSSFFDRAARYRRAARVASSRNRFAVGRLPTPGPGAVTALGNAFLVDLRDDVAVAGEQRFGRAHLGAQRQLALGEPVVAVFLELFLAAVGIGTTGAESAFVHLAARAEVSDL